MGSLSLIWVDISHACFSLLENSNETDFGTQSAHKPIFIVCSYSDCCVSGDSNPLPVESLSIFWQIPQYFLIGASEVFTFIGQLEFFYDQAPDAMRSLMSALSLTTVALGNYLSTVLVTIVTSVTAKDGKAGWIPDNLNRGHLDYFFWTIAILSVLNIIFYLVVSYFYTYKRVQVAAEEDHGAKE